MLPISYYFFLFFLCVCVNMTGYIFRNTTLITWGLERKISLTTCGALQTIIGSTVEFEK